MLSNTCRYLDGNTDKSPGGREGLELSVGQ